MIEHGHDRKERRNIRLVAVSRERNLSIISHEAVESYKETESENPTPQLYCGKMVNSCDPFVGHGPESSLPLPGSIQMLLF